ncbi:MAG: MerR family transcriptional regulator [Sphingomonadaceae bacterium]
MASGNIEKNPDAFRTISEVSRQLNVPQHILRFWETRFPELKPLKRGGNRRYYRPADVRLAAALQQLLHADAYTVKGVQKLIADHGVDGMIAIAENGLAAAETPEQVRPVADLREQLIAIRNRLAAALTGKAASAPTADQRV